MLSKPDSGQPSAALPPWAEQVQRWGAVLLLLIALAASLSSTLRNLDSGYLAGHEFRQSQTALSIHFIATEDNYALSYPTPVFGPPWSIPMEFPLYQWIVARALQTQEDGSLPTTARLVSLLCFYLCLPAGFILLRRVGATRSTALLGLALILAAPVYIYYSRAILIESLVLLLSLWFLVAFERLASTGRLMWVVVTALLGGLAAMVKITTFAIWGGLALVWGVVTLVRLWQRGDSLEAWKRLGWFALAGMVPLIAGAGWLQWADTVKEASPGGFFLTAENLRSHNLGTWAYRVEADLWRQILSHSNLGLLPWFGWAVLAGLWLVPGSRPRSPIVGLLIAAAGLTWFCFPLLYRIHDYYLYAMGVLPLAALALASQRWQGTPRTWWLPLAATVLVMGLQWHSHHRHYAPYQHVQSNGGNTLFDLLRDSTAPDDIVLIVGNDWTAAPGYYMRRRTLMFKLGTNDSPTQRNRMLSSLEGATIAGLLVENSEPRMAATADAVIAQLGLDVEPTFENAHTRFHAHPARKGRIVARYQSYSHYYLGVESAGSLYIPQQTDPFITDQTLHEVTANQAESIFLLVSPSPARYQTQFGFHHEPEGDRLLMRAHPVADFWIDWAADSLHVQLEYGIYHHAYQTEGARSDGVLFQVHGVAADGSETLLWEHFIDPWNNPADRGVLASTFSAAASDFASLRFATRPGPGGAHDAAFWGRITVEP